MPSAPIIRELEIYCYKSNKFSGYRNLIYYILDLFQREVKRE